MTVFYCSRSGNNTDGKTLATAWNELNQIKWPLLAPGDVVEVHNSPFDPDYVKPTFIDTPGKSLIGVNSPRIKFAPRPQATRSIQVMQQAVGTLIQDLDFYGMYDSDSGLGTGIHVFARDFFLRNLKVHASPGEDSVGIQNVGGVIEGCTFTGLVPAADPAVHRDVISAAVPVSQSLVIRNCRFIGNQTDILTFLYSVGGANQGSIIIEDSLFDGGARAIIIDDGTRILSLQELTIRRCWFNNVKSGTALGRYSAVTTWRDCIFSGKSTGSNTGVFFPTNSSLSHCYWQDGTTTFVPQIGNAQGPLTWDANYVLPYGSPATGYGPSWAQPIAPQPPTPAVVIELLDDGTWRKK